MTEKRIIEINGVKLEIDLSTAKRVEEYRVGDKIKVLIKNYNGYKSHAGVIVGFDDFKNLPTIIVAYIDDEYSNSALKFIYYNTNSVDVEICAANENDIPLEKQHVLTKMDNEIEKLTRERDAAIDKKKRFLHLFSQHFNKVSEGTEAR